MRRSRLSLGLFAALFLGLPVRAEAPPDPFRLVPNVADLVLKVEEPRRVVEFVTSHDLFKHFQALEAVREYYDSTNYRRFNQLVAYFEKQLGAGRLELLDRLAGGGLALGTKFGTQPAPALLVMQAKDEQLLRRFVDVGLRIIEQELARQESKERPEKRPYRGIETIHIGKEFHAAVAGSALLLSNNDKALEMALDLAADGPRKSLAQTASVAEARKLVGADASAWLWLNLETVKHLPDARDIFTTMRNDFQLTVAFGGWLDVARRSSFLGAGLYLQDNQVTLSVRLPQGREGMPGGLVTHVPPAGQPGSRALLEPKNVLFSSSFYLDVAKFWEQRGQLFNEKSRKEFEKFDQGSAVFLTGMPFSKLAAQAGPYVRLVAVHQPRGSYSVTPEQRIPAFAVVTEMRQPDSFSKRMDAILRATAFLASTQVKVKTSEEKYRDHKLVSFRFPENGTFPGDDDNFRFNFNPCYVSVGNQFVAASTVELGRELVDLLEREAKEPPKDCPATVRSRFYAAGGVEVIQSLQDRFVTQTILAQAVSPERATEEVNALISLARRLGILQIEAEYTSQSFRYDFQLQFAK